MSRSASIRPVLAVLLALSTVQRAAAAEPAPQGAWLSGVQSRIEAAEYEIRTQGGTYQAPNRAQGFRTSFSGPGIQVVPRIEDEASWEWGLTWIAYGRGDRSWSVPAATLSAEKNRIDYRRGPLSEWYENGPRGLKQGFVLAVPPEELTTSELPLGRAGHDDRLHVDLALTGSLSPVISEDGQAIDFVTGPGTRVLRYDGLLVTDARGRPLPARMSGFVRGIRISIDDTDALFPITIDPLVGSPVWIYNGDQDSAQVGWSVATAGDVNGDGYSDVIVGAPGYVNDSDIQSGATFVFLGSPSGPGPVFAWRATGTGSGGQFGYSVATAGDVNGDGYADVIVGEASAFNLPDFSQGRAHAYYGSASGLSPTPAWTVNQTGGQFNGAFGATVAPAGDVNGDGYADVVVCSPGFAGGESAEGRALVYHGSATGLATTPSWTVEGNQVEASFCASAGTAGDVNGDGYADLVVGATRFDNGQTDEGRAFLYLGSASGLATTAAWTAESDQAAARFGNSVGTAGDVNGDGYADVVVGARWFDNGHSNEGGVFVYHGSAAGLSATAAWTGEGGQTSAEYGDVVATAGDVDGDGYADLLVGAQLFDASQNDAGRTFLYLGSATGLADPPAWTAGNILGLQRFGVSVATAGDVNGDGLSDVVVGQTGPFVDPGRAYVYLGSASGPAEFAGWTAEGNQSSALFGNAVGGAGDVNGDGYADVIVSAPLFDDDQMDEGRAHVYLGSASGMASIPGWTAESNQAEATFGAYSIGTAGDVNGDGYADVIVGARMFDNGQLDEGRAYVFLGSATGPASTPAWTAEGDQPNAHFGNTVGTAGDVNGDGYADVIVGAPSYDNGQTDEGRVFVYHGSASGLDASPAWTAESDQANAFFGSPLATAGDVNGDGYADVIISQVWYSNGETDEGRVLVYHGSASGLAPTPAWIAEGNQPGAYFGGNAGTAGDVNGDGYADVIVGSNWQRRASVYHGSALGLSALPAWTNVGASSFRGGYCAGAGDVNGDGYADVIVGDPDYSIGQGRVGRAYVFLGSASGLPTIPAWAADSGQHGSNFGGSVGTAGDVNGDGYADVIVGAMWYDNGQTEEGRAFLYYGNGGPGVPLTPRQRSGDNSRPIAHLGLSDGPAFHLELQGRTPFGRGKVRLQSEVKLFGQVLTGSVTQTGEQSDTGVTLQRLEDDLASGMPYHWRVRLLYDPATTPFAQHSRWFTVPWGGWNEAMLRTPVVPLGRAPELVLIKAALGITATWTGTGSCVETDQDHALYEGTLGDFTSHVPVTCTTGGNSTWNFTPLPGNRYFLLVPVNPSREGSYGSGVGGAERPPSASACAPQLVAACP